MNGQRGRGLHGATDRQTYRQAFRAEDLAFFPVTVEQTDLLIGIGGGSTHDGRPEKAACEKAKALAFEEVRVARRMLESHIRVHPAFLTSLVPLSAPTGAPPLLVSMYAAAEAAGVGPMAAVAGAVAEQVGQRLLVEFSEVLVENGGDLWMCGRRERRVGLYCGASPLNGKLALRVEAASLPMGICTSSGTIGHSLSLGCADAATVAAKTAALADAVATALGNRIHGAEDIESALVWAVRIKGISGALVILGERLGVMGSLELIPMA